MSGLRLKAPAKINLDLRVLAREESGYHQIETVFLQVDLCDEVVVNRAASGVHLTVHGADLGDPMENLVHRAATAFFAAAGLAVDRHGVSIDLHKVIPAGAGLGGGSSDAAATLRLLNELFDRPLDFPRLLDVAAGLGADVPFFMVPSAYALAWGRGGRLLQLPAPEPRPVVLALPGIHVSTPDAYRALSERGLRPDAPRGLGMVRLRDWVGLASAAQNDFESVVFGLHPLLSDLRDELRSSGAELSLMSGSGSTVFGVFGREDDAMRTAASIREASGVACEVVWTRSRSPEIEPVAA